MKIDATNQKIILDVDTGVDDALAILLLLRLIPEQILGICTVGGNVEVEKTTKNTLSVLSLQDKNIKVYQGASLNISNKSFRYAKSYHGENGLCGIELKNNQKVSAILAEDFIIDSCEKCAGNITLIVVGAPTNLAKALTKKPNISGKINQVIMMGGAVEVKGNATLFAEFNFYQDPEAVKIVLSKIKDVYIVPLDVTGKCLVKKENLVELSSHGKVGNFTLDLIKKWYKIFGDSKNRFFELYDPLAVSAILGDFLDFKTVKVNVAIEGGKEGGLVKGTDFEIQYAYKVRAEKFMQFFYDTINSFKDKMIIFDMDGTLYDLAGGSYEKSQLKEKVTENILKFIGDRLTKNPLEAQEILNKIKEKFSNQISIGLEKEYSFDRLEYFNEVWNIPAKGIVAYTPGLKQTIVELAKKYKLIIVSDAPRVWIDNVLTELGVRELFGDDIFSGEGDDRKEFGNIFQKVLEQFGFAPENCISIGDQERTDIIPAKALGMKTIFVAKGIDCKDADIKIESISELISAVQKVEKIN